jgi:hypothetical protein
MKMVTGNLMCSKREEVHVRSQHVRRKGQCRIECRGSIPLSFSGIKLKRYTSISIKKFLFLWCLVILGQQSWVRIYGARIDGDHEKEKNSKFVDGEIITNARRFWVGVM